MSLVLVVRENYLSSLLAVPSQRELSIVSFSLVFGVERIVSRTCSCSERRELSLILVCCSIFLVSCGCVSLREMTETILLRCPIIGQGRGDRAVNVGSGLRVKIEWVVGGKEVVYLSWCYRGSECGDGGCQSLENEGNGGVAGISCHWSSR